jgi:hypothetical protein
MRDLSHIHANGNLDQAQDNHDNEDPALHDHILKAILHSAGVGEHPGKFKPATAGVVRGNWETPQSNFENQQKESSDALNNLASGGPPRIPAPPSARPTPMPNVPSV